MKEIREMPIQAIKPDPTQPRKDFAEEELQELTQSIRRNGLLNPITVIYTSYFKSPILRDIPLSSQVAISIGVPKGWGGRRYLALAPRWDMLKMAEARYYEQYDQILAKLSPSQVALDLEGCVLLCWEKDPAACHRHYVANWFRAAGIEVEELTGDRLAVGQQALNL